MDKSNLQRGWVASQAITTAVTGAVIGPQTKILGARSLVVQSKFTYGSGSGTAKVYIQTSLDNGATWIDIICHTFTNSSARKVSAVTDAVALAASVAPSVGALSDDTILNGLLGTYFRAVLTTTGTYAATSLSIDFASKN